MRRALALGLVVLGACGGGPRERPVRLNAEVASYDLAAGRDTRFLVALIGPGNRLVIGGTVDLRFEFLGERKAQGSPEPMGTATASFLPLPGQAGPFPSTPTSGSKGRGLYAVESTRFARPGIWRVVATADVDGRPASAEAAFQVLPKPLVPAPGDRALETENLTIGSHAPEAAIDSRAATEGKVPDPELHRITIADAIRARRPALVVFATPVYCVSRFCGPVTDMVEDLAGRYRDRAAFIHVEIWRDYQHQVVNRAAADWLLRNDNLQEPWVFLIGTDGRIVARWDNVATPQEIEPYLKRLPAP